MVIGTLAIAGFAKSSTTYIYQPSVHRITVERPITYVYATDWLKGYLGEVSIKYGLPANDYSEMVATIQCESGWQIYPKPNHISWGIAEFTPPTWQEFGYGDIMNPVSQINIMVKMWKVGLAKRWDCYRLGLYKKYLTQ